MKYYKIFFVQYVLLNFCLNVIGLFLNNAFLWLFMMMMVYSAYYKFKYNKGTLTNEYIYFHLVMAGILLIIFTLCLFVSQGFFSSDIWSLFYVIAFPFYPIFVITSLMGSYIDYLPLIIFIMIYNAIFPYMLLKPQSLQKKIIPIGITCLCLIVIDAYTYLNSPTFKYKGGHNFTYMEGYSSTDLSDYTPYAQNSKLVTLKEESTLIIEDPLEMPILDGAEACYPVYSAIAKAVYKDIDKIELENIKKEKNRYTNGEIVCFTNTSIGYTRLFNHEVDMFFGAKPSVSQLEEAKGLGVELEYTPIGKEAFVFFVNEDNPVDSLTTQQIKDIYHGDITNWNEVGGNNQNIIAFQRPERSGSQAMMTYFMGDTSLKEPLSYEMVTGMGGIIKEVAEYHNDDGAIGYTFKYFLEGLQQEQNVKILSIDGIKPTTDNIKNQSYPISTYLYCVTLKSNQKENVQKLKEFLLSKQGQYIIEETGYSALN